MCVYICMYIYICGGYTLNLNRGHSLGCSPRRYPSLRGYL